MKYQFCVDGRAAGPVRDRWEDAAQDLVDNGYGVFTDDDEIHISSDAEIKRLKEV